MAIRKPRGKDGMRQVFVYDPATQTKVYVGQRKNLRGPGGAEELEREMKAKFAAKSAPPEPEGLTVAEYADEWLNLHHGTNTRRPAKTTLQVNRDALRPLLRDYGHRLLDGGIGRREALAWSKKHQHNASAVSAMFNDAIDDEVAKANPFANRRHTQPRGRKDIHPMTEAEVACLADIALEHWGDEGYGRVTRAWVLFAAWVGCRPGETFQVTLGDLDFREGLATIRRVKKRGNVYPTDVVVFPKAAQDAVRAMPEIPKEGPIFLTVGGRRMVDGALRYHWGPIRAAFRQAVAKDRWAELLEGSRRDLDFYSLRHFCGSVMADRGLSEWDISQQLGNSVEVCREHYIHHYRERTQDRVRRALDGGQVVDIAARRWANG